MNRPGSSRLLSALALTAVLGIAALNPGPASAVLPPGANESLAAKAPLILIGKVVERADDSGRSIAVFQVLEVVRGDLEPGAGLEVELARPPKKKLLGPQVVYHRMTPGQTWLLFLLPPPKKTAPYYSLAAHGWYTQKLDHIPDSAALLSLLPRFTGRNAGALEVLREIYQGAGEWLERNLK